MAVPGCGSHVIRACVLTCFVRRSETSAGFDTKLGEFLLPYEAVRASLDPADTLMRFLQSTYAAAADTVGWERKRLECSTGRPGMPRLVTNV